MSLCFEGNDYGHRPLLYFPSLLALRCALSLVTHASVVVPVREHCTGFPVHPAYGFVPSKAAPKAAPVWSSRKKKRGLRGTVVIFSDRADAVTAGVLMKEIVFLCSQQYKLRSHAVE